MDDVDKEQFFMKPFKEVIPFSVEGMVNTLPKIYQINAK